MMVLDASALVDVLLNTAAGRDLAQRIRSSEVTLHSPHLVDLEVAQTLRRYVRQGELDDERAQVALQHLALLDLDRYALSEFLPRVWALEANVTAFDAAYLALAEALGAVLVTADRGLAKAPCTRAAVEVIEEPGPSKNEFPS